MRAPKRVKIVPQGQQNRLHWRKRTARNKLVPRGQQNRLHQNEDRNQIGASGSSKSAPSKKAHCKNKIGTSRSTKSTSSKWGQNEKLVPLGQRNRPNWRKRTVKNKIASRSPKSTSPTKAPTKGSRQNAIRRAWKLKDKRPFPYYYKKPYSNKKPSKILPWL